MGRFDLNPDAEAMVRLRERVFTPQRLSVTGSVSMFTLETIQLDAWQDYMLDALVLRMTAELLAERVEEQAWTFTEQPGYPSPRHAYLDSLPVDSLRRRFLAYLWGMDPREQMSTIVTHTVTVQRWERFPENPQAYPLGRPYRIQEIVHD